MEPITLRGITRLENNVVVLNNATLKQIVEYINKQTSAINQLSEELNKSNAKIDELTAAVSEIRNNTKTLAIALKGVYSK